MPDIGATIHPLDKVGTASISTAGIGAGVVVIASLPNDIRAGDPGCPVGR